MRTHMSHLLDLFQVLDRVIASTIQYKIAFVTLIWFRTRIHQFVKFQPDCFLMKGFLPASHTKAHLHGMAQCVKFKTGFIYL